MVDEYKLLIATQQYRLETTIPTTTTTAVRFLYQSDAKTFLGPNGKQWISAIDLARWVGDQTANRRLYSVLDASLGQG